MDTQPPSHEDGPLILQPVRPDSDVLNRTTILAGVGLLLVALFGGMYYALHQRSTELAVPPAPPVSAQTMAGANPPLERIFPLGNEVTH